MAEHAELPDDIEFPLKTTDDLNKLAENLKDKTTRNQLISKLIVLLKCIDSVSYYSSYTDIRYRKLLIGMKTNQRENSVILMLFFAVDEGFRVG